MVRLKTRYVLFEVLFPVEEASVDSKEFMRALRDSLQTFFGDTGLGRCQNMLGLKFYSKDTGLGILRVGRGQEKLVQAALTLVTEIDTVPVIIRTRHVSGTIVKSQERALEISKVALTELKV